jgi:hypothetical protein
MRSDPVAPIYRQNSQKSRNTHGALQNPSASPDGWLQIRETKWSYSHKENLLWQMGITDSTVTLLDKTNVHNAAPPQNV